MANVGAGLRPAQPSHRKAQRLPQYDYASAGAYFVTVCVKDRLPILGTMVGSEVRLTRAGELITEVWNDLPQHYDFIELDEFIVMPNHVHGIVWISSNEPTDDSVGAGLRPAQSVREGLRPSPTKKPPGLSEIVRSFKSFSAREIHKANQTTGSFWQRGFYEHIIRNDDDLYQHRAYVRNNSLKWALDEYYS
ncbi:MAG: transposase [Anaerolineales bacterium]